MSSLNGTVDDRERRWALFCLCQGVLMIGVNSTIVNVALPSIRIDLRFSEASLVWIVNAYLATFGGFLLLSGRLGDLFGRRRLFMFGLASFTLASLGCGLATSSELLIAARSWQGLGGAIVSAVALSEIMNLFTEAPQRAKALGIYAFVSASGGSIGLLLGGILTSALSWHWVFLVNVPIGVGAYALCITSLPCGETASKRGRLDIAGAVTVTTSLMLAVYAILSSTRTESSVVETLSLLGTACLLLVVFVGIEARSRTPLMPLKLLQTRNLVVASVVGVLLTVTLLAWRFISALYLQLVLDFTPLEVGLTFLPGNLILAVMSLVVSPALVIRFGIRRPLVIGLLITGVGLALLARVPVTASVVIDVLPGMLLLGLGTGMAYSPLLLGALSSVASDESGAASGIVNTSLTMGGALGLSILASVAAVRTRDLLGLGVDPSFALREGYLVAFWIGAAFAVLAALISGLFIRGDEQKGAIARSS